MVSTLEWLVVARSWFWLLTCTSELQDLVSNTHKQLALRLLFPENMLRQALTHLKNTSPILRTCLGL